MQPPSHILSRLALWPLSQLYRSSVRARAAAYRRGWLRIERLPVPVISIGNLTVGGTGKTPLVEKLCRLLEETGHRTAVVSRGFGRRSGEAVTIVSRGDGEGPRVDVTRAGDEPFLLARRLPRTAVLVGADRVAAGRAAIDQFGAEVIVADDAYQHLRLARDLDLLAIDATNPIDAGWLLPSGGLREPLEAARRAGAFVLTRCDRVGQTTHTENLFLGAAPGTPVFHSISRPVALLLPDGKEVPPETIRGETVAAFCGIGKPRFFLQDLQRQQANVAAFLEFPDHHWYHRGDLERVAERAREVGASLVLTTEKDHARLTPELRGMLPLAQVRIEVEIWEDRRFRKFLAGRLGEEIAA